MTAQALELAERAWINIVYARAELMRSHLNSETYLRVVGHLDDALDDLKALAPENFEPMNGEERAA
ncbi:hypothetical protein CCR94_10975 [Rhodoblastus sphagnicola]|uniref:Uncharacterized protein n=1 Tax=Rhodoblastus sphagnicola TaxID=333368 RepID=A0A2S6N8D1_9HYPH|nr:hypothetical protein [Rhodoblastus sphagnicola]MBB4198168.1 hypothetical protein [Rhodoblastus sphagnicola]PPQ30873.1 hypothetical protein CCR94_10975 [Rhodoblastus sphagnicola]